MIESFRHACIYSVYTYVGIRQSALMEVIFSRNGHPKSEGLNILVLEISLISCMKTSHNVYCHTYMYVLF